MKKIWLIIITLCCFTEQDVAAQSLYQDVKARRVGDVITVILAENITGSASTDASTQSNTAGSSSASLSGNFLPFEPFFGADATVDYNADERISANQSQLLRGTISVRIKEIGNDGSIQVEGARKTEINGEEHTITVKGFIRSIDINDLNEVMSYRIADAEIVYLKKDGLKQLRRKTGFFRKALFFVAGAAAAVAAVMSSGATS